MGFGPFYLHPDHLDTPRLVTDTANQVLWRWDHGEPFGNSPENSNPSGLGTFGINYRFPGQYLDRASNTHYNYHRDYGPAEGRYIQSDPIGLTGGINTYAYVRSNPMQSVDPLGLAGIGFGGGGNYFAAVGGLSITGSVVFDPGNLNLCIQSVRCARFGLGYGPYLATGGLAVQASFTPSTLCSGSYKARGVFATGSVGAMLGIGGIRSPDPGSASVQSTNLLGGVGLPGGAGGYEECEISLMCFRDPPCCRQPGGCKQQCDNLQISDIIAP